MDKKLLQILPQVSSPARYTNGELNAIHKDWDTTTLKMCLAFPDIYDIGMANLGFKILYHIINQQQACLGERAYLPWIDMQEQMIKAGLPLTALESGKPLSEFDIIGFTLQHETSYTNVVKMLDLADIPRFSAERKETDPLIIAGGPCSFNCEPIVDFLDCVVLGDGEEVLKQILELAVAAKEQNIAKEELLRQLAKLEGVYVPRFYRAVYNDNGDYMGLEPLKQDLPLEINKNLVENLDQAFYPDTAIVPYTKVVFERAVVEVMRGCTRGCRFCQAGMIYRPVRERSVEVLKKQVAQLIKNTGYEEISLSSLSTGDYSCIQQLISELVQEYEGQGVSVALPSLRVDSFSVKLAEQIQKVRKSGITFAPEAGTQRLRDVINKNVTEADLYDAVESAFQAGWHQVKLYFMIGLPTEEFADLDGIVSIAKNALEIGWKYYQKGRRKPTVVVSVSSFVPKSHTPFQWEAMDSIEVLLEKQAYLRKHLSHPGISFQYHNVHISYLEAILARGDRRLAATIARAVDLGCQFDSWHECFDFKLWEQALQDTNIDGNYFANRQRAKDEILPWDHLKCGVSKGYLWREREKAFKEETTPDCRFTNCTGCGLPKCNIRDRG